MRHVATFLLLVGATLCSRAEAEDRDFASLSTEVQQLLLQGDAVVLSRRPDELEKLDKRFVSVAKIISGTREEIWEVINDKDGAENFLEGVLESDVISTSENGMVVSQRTKVGGPKASYSYTLSYVLTPMERSEFTFVKGEMRNVAGCWWILKGPELNRMLVVYSLFIDPGFFAPQAVVKRGMKKTMPSTVRGIEEEVERRKIALEAEEE